MATIRKRISLRRPVVWVVGASRGIGREIAKQFASIGCEVCLSSRSKRELEKTIDEIQFRGGRAYSFPCDTSKKKSISSTSKNILQQFRSIDVLINNAGITVFKSVVDTSAEEFSEMIQTNLEGPILCIKSVLPGMIKQREGWIFNILSTAAIETFEGSGAYTATKAGMLGACNVLREEVRPFNIKVVNVLPGPTETAMWKAADRKKYSHRMMRATSVAEAVLSMYQLPSDVVAEEIVLRPIQGDID